MNSVTAFSIVIPFYNEEGNARLLLEELSGLYPNAEIFAVDDGSTDKTRQEIESVTGVHCIALEYNRGQSAALLAGLQAASHPWCVVLDGDRQNDPSDIPRLLNLLDGSDAVFGYREKRKDSWSRRWASRLANRVRRIFIRDGIRDTGCSLKAFRREMVSALPPVDCMHRFMGAFFRKAGYSISEIPVKHHPRVVGKTKYTNFGRAVRGIYDLVGVSWYLKRTVNTRKQSDA